MQRIPELDGLRAVAILPVLAFHAEGRFFPGGFLGVDLFFVLSGFLITGLLIDEMRTTGVIYLRNFYRRRALRILPPLFAAIALAMALSRIDPGVALAAILFYANLLDPATMGTLSHTWSLSVEEHFYLAWPFLFTLRRKSLILAIAIFVAIGVRFILMAEAVDPVRIHRFTFAHVDALAIGCFCAIHFARLRLIVNREWLSVCALAAMGFCFVATGMNSSVMISWGFTAFAVVCAIALVSILSIDEDSAVRRLMRNPALRYIGLRSYGLYLYHFPVFTALSYLQVAGSPAKNLLVTALKIAVTFAVAELSYRSIERYAAKLRLPQPAVV